MGDRRRKHTLLVVPIWTMILRARALAFVGEPTHNVSANHSDDHAHERPRGGSQGGSHFARMLAVLGPAEAREDTLKD
eukprot:scaffold20433_cov31-Tisochrysis_lutea.AAC.1